MSGTDKKRQLREVLPDGCELYWYTITRILGRGAFGVTYLGKDNNLNQQVAIKEYFPSGFALRETGYTVVPITGEHREMFDWGLTRFFDEAQVLAKFRHPNIVRVLSVFKKNNTAYMVMEYEQGNVLSDVYKQKGSIDEKQLLSIFLPILDGLKLVHDAEFLHRDVKPSNIFLREDGTPVLIDFGAARQAMGDPRGITNLVTHGFTPIEQYAEGKGKQGPWTDIYSFGATLYMGITAKRPPEATLRASAIISTGKDPYEPLQNMYLPTYSPAFLKAIDRALSFRWEERPASLEAWQAELTGETVESPVIPSDPGRPHTMLSQPKANPVPPSVNKVLNTENVNAPSPAPIPYVPRSVSRKQDKRRKVRRAVAVLLTGCFVLFGAGILMNEMGANNVERARILIKKANKAVTDGRLIKPEKNSAAWYYREVLAIQSQNEMAARRLDALFKKSKTALLEKTKSGHLEDARQDLNRLVALFPERNLTDLSEKLTSAEAAAQIARLLRKAKKAYDEDHLIQPNNTSAASFYERVLAVSPGHAQAAQGLERIRGRLSALALDAIEQGQLKKASAIIENIARYNERTAGKIPKPTADTHRQLATALWLKKAEIKFEKNQLTKPKDDNALHYFREVLEWDDNNETAIKGINAIQLKLFDYFQDAVKNKNIIHAETQLKKLENTYPGTVITQKAREAFKKIDTPGNRNRSEIYQALYLFRKALEHRNMSFMKKINGYGDTRYAALKSMLANYNSFKVRVSDVRFGKQNQNAKAKIRLLKLVTKKNKKEKPSPKTTLKVLVKKDARDDWKIYW